MSLVYMKLDNGSSTMFIYAWSMHVSFSCHEMCYARNALPWPPTSQDFLDISYYLSRSRLGKMPWHPMFYIWLLHLSRHNLASWSSKWQDTVSRSSSETEYKGVVNAVAETCLIWNLLLELKVPITTTTLVYCDNVSAVYLSNNPVKHQWTKHVEIDIHFVREKVPMGEV